MSCAHRQKIGGFRERRGQQSDWRELCQKNHSPKLTGRRRTTSVPTPTRATPLSGILLGTADILGQIKRKLHQDKSGLSSQLGPHKQNIARLERAKVNIEKRWSGAQGAKQALMQLNLLQIESQLKPVERAIEILADAERLRRDAGRLTA